MTTYNNKNVCKMFVKIFKNKKNVCKNIRKNKKIEFHFIFNVV